MTLTDLNAWKELEKNYTDVRGQTMRDMFDADPNRFEEFSVSLNNLLLDYSKNRITNCFSSFLTCFICEVSPKSHKIKSFDLPFTLY